MSTDTSASGRAWARVGFTLGATASLGFNLQDAWLQVDGHAPYGKQAGAVMWPLVLIATVEVMSRVTWPTVKGFKDGGWRTWGWPLARFGGFGTIGVTSAVISYTHVYAVLIYWGYSPAAARAGAVCLDGLMVLCGFAMLANSLAAKLAAPTSGSVAAPGQGGGSLDASPASLPGPDQHQPPAPLGLVPDEPAGITAPHGAPRVPAGSPSSATPTGPGVADDRTGGHAEPPVRSLRGHPEDTAPHEDTGREDTGRQVYLAAVPEDTKDTSPGVPARTPRGHRVRAAGTPRPHQVVAPVGVPEDTDLVSLLRGLREDTEDTLTTVRPVANALRIGKERARRVLELDATMPPPEGAK